MKITVIVSYRRNKKSKPMHFLRVVDMTLVPASGDYVTFTRVDGSLSAPVTHCSPVLAKAHGSHESPVRFRVSERELFTQPQVGFGNAVIYAKPSKRAAHAIVQYIIHNRGEQNLFTPEEMISRWMAAHGFIPLSCAFEFGRDKRWAATTPSGRDHYDIATMHLQTTVSLYQNA